MPHYTKDLNEIIKGLEKASKLHAKQAKQLRKINEDQKKKFKNKHVAKKPAGRKK
jgi:hypothetical protein|tara:strand:+ start:303 stop:467 length:165 start_codon:yes stop_codon:yes gene_type:complete